MRRQRSISDTRYEREIDIELERERKRKEMIRKEWLIRQQKAKEHEELKRKKIEEYERKRAEKLALERKEKREREYRRSRSESRSPHHRGRTSSNDNARYTNYSKSPRDIFHDKSRSERTKPMEGKSHFKGPEDSNKVDVEELRKITVKIERDIPRTATETSEIRRDVINPEEIIIKRREGEGSKPLFTREEFNAHDVESVKERRSVITKDKSILKPRAKSPPSRSPSRSRRRSRSLSPRRRRSSSRSRHSSRSAYYESSRSKDRNRSSNRNSERHSTRRTNSREDSRRPERRRSHSLDRDSYRRSDRDYKDDKSENRSSYDHRERRDYSRERHQSTGYMEPIPYPTYFGPYPMRAMPMRPLLLPGMPQPMPLHYPPPRFMGPVGQDIYRNRRPPNPRFPKN